jgi:hypothetical protein
MDNHAAKAESVPTYVYSYSSYIDKLYRTHLLTGRRSRQRLPKYPFRSYCCLSELPGGGLLVTGGGDCEAVRKVERIDPLREFAVCAQAPMHTARRMHTAVHHSHYLYVLGGFGFKALRECERYVCAEGQWEKLPALPVACYYASAVVLENSLYALGGMDSGSIPTNIAQKLRLERLTWELMQLKLPDASYAVPCFKRDSQVYLVLKKTLYSFTPLQVTKLKTLTKHVKAWYGASYYSRGSLYCSNRKGAATRLEVGWLN